MMRNFTTFPARTLFRAALAVSLFAGSAAAEPFISRPFDPGIDCTRGLDSIGAALAAGGDFDGDGIGDFAYGAPCLYIPKAYGVGRVWIRSGKDGSLLRVARGSQAGMYFGAALAFVGDLNGDGKDDLAIGAPFYDAPGVADTVNVNAGQVTVLTAAGTSPLLTVVGDFPKAELGASLDGIADLDGDQIPDLLVGAPGRQRSESDTTRSGAVLLLSGKDGAQLQLLVGQKPEQRFGTTVQDVGLADSDELHDFLVTSEKNPVGQLENAGAAEVYSGADPTQQVFDRIGGAKNDRLGASSSSLGIDGTFIIGAPGTRIVEGVLDLRRAGLAAAIKDDGSRAFTVSSAEPQENGQFGAAVAMLSDVSGDGVADYASSEPFADMLTPHTGGSVGDDVGRVTLLSGVNGKQILTIDGNFREARLGRALSGGIDLNDDGIGDIISGNPGDTPAGRRGAGTVRVFSGTTGSLIRAFKGRRGFQTRIYSATLQSGAVTVRGWGSDGRPRGVNTAALFKNLTIKDVSIDAMDRAQNPVVPGQNRIVVGAGRGSESSRVAVLAAGVKSKVLAEFDAFPGQKFGSNVAAGDLENDGVEEIVVAQAASGNGEVRLNVFKALPQDPVGTAGWTAAATFLAFATNDVIGASPINADGANVLVTGLRPESGREIVVSPYLGAPVVRVLGSDGKLLLQWLAYDDNAGFKGVSIAAADLDNDGSKEILTAPMSGPVLIRAFSDDGLPFSMPGSASPVSFYALPQDVTSGARVSSADVDLDGRQEILVVSRRADKDEILAFEPDGTPVHGYKPIDPASKSSAAAVAATDRFVRK